MRVVAIVLVVVVVCCVFAAVMQIDQAISGNNARVAEQQTLQKAYEAQQKAYEAKIAEMNKEIEYMRESYRTERFQLTLVALNNNRGDLLLVLGFIGAFVLAGAMVWFVLSGRDRY